MTNACLAEYTSWRVGGNAHQLFIPEDKAGLCAFVSQLAGSQDLFWMGFGSNLLVRDGGIPGVVINTRGRLKQMHLQDTLSVYVEAGVPCAHVARFCAEQGLTGAEFLAGIPGTLGGALKMNAGAFGGATWTLVSGVETIDSLGQVHQRPAKEFTVHYGALKDLENIGFWRPLCNCRRATALRVRRKFGSCLQSALKPSRLISRVVVRYLKIRG